MKGESTGRTMRWGVDLVIRRRKVPAADVHRDGPSVLEIKGRHNKGEVPVKGVVEEHFDFNLGREVVNVKAVNEVLHDRRGLCLPAISGSSARKGVRGLIRIRASARWGWMGG